MFKIVFSKFYTLPFIWLFIIVVIKHGFARLVDDYVVRVNSGAAVK